MSADLVAPSAHGNLDKQISQLMQVATAIVLSIKPPSSPTSSFPPISRRSCLQQHCRCCGFFHHQPPQPRYLSSPSTVIKLMQSFKSKEYVRETFAWMHYYRYLTNDGIEFLGTYLNLPSEIVPAMLKKSAKPLGGPPGDRPRFM